MKGTNFLCNSTVLFLSNIGISKIVNKGSFAMINMSHDCYNWWFLLHFEFLTWIEISTIDDADNFELLFWN